MENAGSQMQPEAAQNQSNQSNQSNQTKKERCLLQQTQQQRNNSSSTIANYCNTVAQKENDNSPETKLEVMKDCDLTDKRIQNSRHEETQ